MHCTGRAASRPCPASSCYAALEFSKEIGGVIYTMKGFEIVKINDTAI